MDTLLPTGKQRATTLTVTKSIGGISEPDYPKVYSIFNAFGIYTQITQDVLKTLAVTDYIKRRDAFILYVNSAEPGLNVTSANSYI